MSKTIPAEAEATAILLINEYAWSRADLPGAIHALAAADFVILGIEVWGVRPRSECAENEPTSTPDNLEADECGLPLVDANRPDWIVYPAMATRDDGPPSTFGWSVASREGEAWQSFVVRSSTEALTWLKIADVEGRVVPQLANRVYYNVAFVNKDEASKLFSPGELL